MMTTAMCSLREVARDGSFPTEITIRLWNGLVSDVDAWIWIQTMS